jgi:hypothetical protein
MTSMRPPNKVTGASAGGSRRLAMRTHCAARVAQFVRRFCSTSQPRHEARN